MKTDELIETLSHRLEPVDVRMPVRRLLVAAAVGVAAALPLMLWQLGMNPDLATDALKPMFWVKFAVVAAIAVASAVLVVRLGRPGAPVRPAGQTVLLPFPAIWALAAVVLMLAALDECMPMLMGSTLLVST